MGTGQRVVFLKGVTVAGHSIGESGHGLRMKGGECALLEALIPAAPAAAAAVVVAAVSYAAAAPAGPWVAMHSQSVVAHVLRLVACAEARIPHWALRSCTGRCTQAQQQEPGDKGLTRGVFALLGPDSVEGYCCCWQGLEYGAGGVLLGVWRQSGLGQGLFRAGAAGFLVVAAAEAHTAACGTAACGTSVAVHHTHAHARLRPSQCSNELAPVAFRKGCCAVEVAAAA